MIQQKRPRWWQRGESLRQGELVAEMAGSDEAKRIYVQLVGADKKELEWDLTTILCEGTRL